MLCPIQFARLWEGKWKLTQPICFLDHDGANVCWKQSEANYQTTFTDNDITSLKVTASCVASRWILLFVQTMPLQFTIRSTRLH